MPRSRPASGGGDVVRDTVASLLANSILVSRSLGSREPFDPDNPIAFPDSVGMALKGSADRKARQPLSRSRKAPLEKRLPRGLVEAYRSLRGSQWRPHEVAAAILVARAVEALPELVDALREDEPQIVFLVQAEEERQWIANAVRRGLLPTFGLQKVLWGPQVAGLRFEEAGPDRLGMVFVGDQIVGRERRRRPEGLTQAMRLPGPIAIVGTHDDVPREVRKIADATIEVPPLDGGTLAEVMSICLAPTETEPEPVPDDLLRDLSLEDLPMFMRPGDTRSRAAGAAGAHAGGLG